MAMSEAWETSTIIIKSLVVILAYGTCWISMYSYIFCTAMLFYGTLQALYIYGIATPVFYNFLQFVINVKAGLGEITKLYNTELSSF